MQVHQYPTIKSNWFLKPFSTILENNIEYDVLLSSGLPGEDGWCEVAINVRKQFEDFVGVIIFEGSITSSFKVNDRRENMTVKMLYELLQIAGLNFSVAFSKLVKGSSLEGTKIAKPAFEDYERYLSRVMQNSN